VYNIQLKWAALLPILILQIGPGWSQKPWGDWDLYLGLSEVSSMNKPLRVVARNDHYFKPLLLPGYGAEVHAGLRYKKTYVWLGFGYTFLGHAFVVDIKDDYPPPWNSYVGSNADNPKSYDAAYYNMFSDHWLGMEQQIWARGRHSLAASGYVRYRWRDYGFMYEMRHGISAVATIDENGELVEKRAKVFRMEVNLDDTTRFVNPSLGLTYRFGIRSQVFVSAMYNFAKPVGYGYYKYPIFDKDLGGTLKMTDNGLYIRVGVDINLRKFYMKSNRKQLEMHTGPTTKPCTAKGYVAGLLVGRVANPGRVYLGVSELSSMHHILKPYDRNDDIFKTKILPGLGLGTELALSTKYGKPSLHLGYQYYSTWVKIKTSRTMTNPFNGATTNEFKYSNASTAIRGQYLGLGWEYPLARRKAAELSIGYLLRVNKVVSWYTPPNPWEINGGKFFVGHHVTDPNGDTIGIQKSTIFEHAYSSSGQQWFANHGLGLTFRYGHRTNFFVSLLYNFTKPYGYGHYSFPIFGSNYGGKLKFSDQGVFLKTGIEILLIDFKKHKKAPMP
jgi:hypothetical protein